MGQNWTGAALPAVLMMVAPHVAFAQTEARQTYNIPEQDLASALNAFAAVSGREVVASSDVLAGKRSGAAVGPLSPEAAIERILAGTGLSYRLVEGAFIIRPLTAPNTGSAPPVDGAQIVVTGSRIRGAPIASPVISIGQREIRNAGHATLAEVVRSIPQSFGGGQNPGVGNNVPAGNGVNVGGATSINLRGIGSDATLTLLDGHRLSYTASRQAIDVSSIPLGAIDRIEIVPDGASALYGSDAVAGVANIILKQDFDGIETSARLGTSTDGGEFEQRYGVVAGSRWSSGGVIATYEFGRTTQIQGKDRSYTRDRPELTLFPSLKNHSAVLSAHQRIGGTLSADVDVLYNRRFSASSYAQNAAGDVTQGGVRYDFDSESFVVAPTIHWMVGSDWHGFLTGSYGRDHTRYDVTLYSSGVATTVPSSCYCNDAISVELGGDGPVAALPAGPIKLALGIGYRSNDFVRFNGVGAATNVSHDQDSYYGYGELSVPLIGPDQEVSFARSLTATAAARYERYPGVGEIVTPKLGLIYAPIADLSLKASWGKSFRAPTLYQQYQLRNLVLATPDIFGGGGYPPDAPVLFLQGGNPDLKPERATTWSATVDLHPRGLKGASLELSYFSVDYRDRIVTPITYPSQALSNPLYEDRLIRDPSASLLAEVIAGAGQFSNATMNPYDPASVAVLIDDSNINAGRQTIRGIDALFAYESRIGASDDQLSATLNATYLESEQQLGPDQPVTQLAGTIFNPAHFRARGGLSWSNSAVTVSTHLNYIGGVDDVRRSPSIGGSSMATVDWALRYQTGESDGPFAGLDLVLSAQNIFDEHPPSIAVTSYIDAPYDSTNYSAVGRFVSLSVRKKW
jgi:iron complex outermembrane receptor protein